MWGIIPAAGIGSRIQPLAFSKELLPVGVRRENGMERPRAVSEYLVERLARGGATKVCFVISPHKADILKYYGDQVDGVSFAYVVQPRAAGL
ncbi:MAG TPA: nucleotidyltransferase family protein, partial [Armatimonadota bacterium]|nr:nucleotidyltransferase family protein [Armatimonadota bacterium]